MRILLIAVLAVASLPAGVQERGPLTRAAVDAGRWIESTRLETDAGATWPAAPGISSAVSFDLYSGTAGVVLFFVDLHRATGDQRWMERALEGARALADDTRASAQDVSAGLYTGLAGRCFVLDRVAEAADQAGLRTATDRCLSTLIARASARGEGVEWNETTDVIGGSAGIGLTLLWAHERHTTDGALETAIAAGDRLLELARPHGAGSKWAMTAEFRV